MHLTANISLLFQDLPLLDRFQAAKTAGFETVEIQFPYSEKLSELIAAKRDAKVEVAMINLPAGDLAAGDVGLTAVTGREADYDEAVQLAEHYARGLNVRKINSLFGRPANVPHRVSSLTAIRNLRHSAEVFGKLNITVVVEPVSPAVVPGFFLPDLKAALDLTAEVDRANVGILFDLFHMYQTEPSLVDAIRQAGPSIRHVQFADVPGRGQPGTGQVDFASAFAALREVGFNAEVGAEYNAVGLLAESLAWMRDFPKWAQGKGK